MNFETRITEFLQEFENVFIFLGFVLLAVVVYVFGGVGIIGTLLLIVAIIVAAALRRLVLLWTSVMLTALLKANVVALKLLTAPWLGGPRHDAFLAGVDAVAYTSLFFAIFLLLYLLEYALGIVTQLIGSFKPIRCRQTFGNNE